MRSLAIFVLAVLLACGAPSNSEAQGTLKVALPASLTTLDPHKAKNAEEFNLNFLIYNGLTEIDREMRVRPDLAERWTASDDLKTWTFHLRPGVRFHSGRELEAEDVVATIRRLLDPATASIARANFLVIERVEAVDRQTVRFTLSIPYAALPEILGERHARIAPRESLDTLVSQPIGTGPFKFKSYRPGDRIELVRNEQYYLKGQPVLDAVTFRIMPESAAQSAALQTGEVDVVWNLPLEAIDQFKANKNVVIDQTPTSSWDGIIMNAAKPPFNDVRVRQAVAAMIDKKQLVEVALFGNGTPTHAMIPPTHPAYNRDLPIAPPDVATAKRLLAEAGLAKGFDIALYVPNGRPNRERIGVAVREMLRPAGIRVNLQRVPWEKFVSGIEGKAEFYVDGFLSRATVDSAIYPFFHSKGSWNGQLWHYHSEKMDKIIDASRSARTPEEQQRFYREFQALAVQDAPGVIPYVINHVNAYRKNVQNFHSSPMMWLDLRQVSVQ